MLLKKYVIQIDKKLLEIYAQTQYLSKFYQIFKNSMNINAEILYMYVFSHFGMSSAFLP